MIQKNLMDSFGHAYFPITVIKCFVPSHIMVPLLHAGLIMQQLDTPVADHVNSSWHVAPTLHIHSQQECEHP